MTLTELEAIKKEFEEINRKYREAFTLHDRLELVERVKKLMSILNVFVGG